MVVFIPYPHPVYGLRYVARVPAPVAQPYGYHYLYPTYIPFTNYAAPAIPSDYADLLDVAVATHLSNLPAVLGHR
ncbi:MAG: hypothetical protein P4N41_02030 [Negativicutes bacterium]|nr:hypothetical protein [Negativicutes bacterium]